MSGQGLTDLFLRLCRLDEFYSWYQYSPELEGKSVSAAAYVKGETIGRFIPSSQDATQLTHLTIFERCER